MKLLCPGFLLFMMISILLWWCVVLAMVLCCLTPYGLPLYCCYFVVLLKLSIIACCMSWNCHVNFSCCYVNCLCCYVIVTFLFFSKVQILILLAKHVGAITFCVENVVTLLCEEAQGLIHLVVPSFHGKSGPKL
jgi:hypothetical protein